MNPVSELRGPRRGRRDCVNLVESPDPVASAAREPSLGEALVERARGLLERFPFRLTGGGGERGLQEACAKELEELGGVAEWHSFRWGRSIYASLALHFGLGAAAAVLGFWAPSGPGPFGAPAVAVGVHLVVAFSYWSESALKRPLLRWALPSARSQNAVVTFAPRQAMRHRIVTLAHADAAYTGFLFTPSIVRMAAKETRNPIGRLFRKGLALATLSLLSLAVAETAAIFTQPPMLVRAIVIGVLAIPSLLAFVANLDVVLKGRIVPAANDNLSGCVATLELARRLASSLPDDIELVTVITGCEEAGAGGATQLMRDVVAAKRWSPTDTTVLALDTFSNGEPRLLQEGELIARPIPPRLLALSGRVDSTVTPYEIPSGATDAWPFLIAGFESLAITCIDPSLGAPRHYHLPSDTAENLDAAAFEKTFVFTERFIAALAEERSTIRS